MFNIYIYIYIYIYINIYMYNNNILANTLITQCSDY